MPALGAHEGGHPSGRQGLLDLGPGPRQGEVVGEVAHHRVDGVDLLEGGRDRRVTLQLGRDEDRPELGADAARAQPREVGVGGQPAGREVEPIPVVAGALAGLPREVVVPVEDGMAREERPDAALGVVEHARDPTGGGEGRRDAQLE